MSVRRRAILRIFLEASFSRPERQKHMTFEATIKLERREKHLLFRFGVVPGAQVLTQVVVSHLWLTLWHYRNQEQAGP